MSCVTVPTTKEPRGFNLDGLILAGEVKKWAEPGSSLTEPEEVNNELNPRRLQGS